MKREIKFRGLDEKLNWQYGTYFYGCMYPTAHDDHYINGWVVDPETIGEFSGCKDRSGADIFEGDIMQPEKFIKSKMMRGKVAFTNDGFKIIGKMYGSDYLYKQIHNGRSAFNDIIIIGNIHQNPDPLAQININQ